MADQPLDSTMRMRVRIVAICSGLLFLMGVGLAVLSVATHSGVASIALSLGLGLGIPAVFGGLMWWKVRQWRADPDVRRRQPSKKATQANVVGGVISLFLANVARSLMGGDGWAAWVVCLAVLLVCSLVTFAVVKRIDPRMHYFKKPDPLPEGQQPDQEESSPVW